ncbi:TraB/GumN family protein [Novosphingobium sp.]|uniref:TraB/GumN family protein n=1 Tax=Novosphingobium sp. TaxID=1874826 RepID=UPI001EB9AB51|nr:TraB/GumN family protein [Novosphingobium sp.]MBK9011794.1 TraB/GumN family protein [Novosphingobium sp.]
MKPIRRFAALLAALSGLALALPAPAQERAPTSPPLETAPAPGVGRPALWKVADADTTIYIFGTIHLLPKGIAWYDGALASAFEQSSELVTEIPELEESAAGSAVLKHGMLPAGQALRGLMTVKEKAKFEAAMRANGLPPASFDRFKPWYAAVVLTTVPLQRKGFDIEHGVESELAERNKAVGRPRTGLETIDYQLGLFNTLPMKAQKKYLMDVIDALPTLEKDVNEMVAAWQKGDESHLASLLNAEQDDPALAKVLLIDRNKAWANWIRGRLDRPGVVFMAVGAGHLGGKGSVQDQLVKAGIPTSRVQ